MTQLEKEEADRNYNNFHTSAYWNAIMNKEQVNYLLQERGDFLYCHGHGRKLVVDSLTSDSYKVYTKPF